MNQYIKCCIKSRFTVGGLTVYLFVSERKYPKNHSSFLHIYYKHCRDKSKENVLVSCICQLSAFHKAEEREDNLKII